MDGIPQIPTCSIIAGLPIASQKNKDSKYLYFTPNLLNSDYQTISFLAPGLHHSPISKNRRALNNKTILLQFIIQNENYPVAVFVS
jgi:hypothetical protein